MAVPCNAGSVVGHYCPSQSRTQLYSGARTDALDPNEGARHQKEIRGINGTGEVSSLPSERRNRGVNISWGPLHSRSSRPQHSPNHAKDF